MQGMNPKTMETNQKTGGCPATYEARKQRTAVPTSDEHSKPNKTRPQDSYDKTT